MDIYQNDHLSSTKLKLMLPKTASGKAVVSNRKAAGFTGKLHEQITDLRLLMHSDLKTQEHVLSSNYMNIFR